MRARAPSLARRTAWGFIWAMISAVSGKALSFIALLVLARLLAPAEFGLFALALVYLTYLDTVGDLGTGAALMYWPDRRNDAAQLTFLVNVGMGAVLTAVTLLAAPAMAAFFREPQAEPVLRALAWSFVLKGLGNTHDALCKKDLRFKARLVPDLGLAGVKAAIAVVLALSGFGVWSLVWGQLGGLAVWALLLWLVVPWRPALRWPRDLLRPVFGYSGKIIVVNVIAAVTHHADAVVIGRMLGATALGFYQIAYRLPEMLVALLVWQASRVLFPAFARVHAAGTGLTTAYVTSLRYISLLALPAVVGMVVMAEPVVLVAFGETWRPAVPILRALAVYCGIRAIGTPAGDVLKAAGRPGLLAGLGVVKATILVPALLLAGRTSAAGVATAMAAVAVVTLSMNLALVRRAAGIPLRAIGGAFRESAPAAAVLGAVLGGWLVLTDGAVGVLPLAGGAAVGGAAYLATLRVLAPDLFRRIRDVLAPAAAAARTPPDAAALGASV